MWATPNVVVVGASVMPAGNGVGDHQLFVIDFLTPSLVGASPPRVVRAAARRLNSMLEKAADKYRKKYEDQVARHRVIDRAGEAHETILSKEVCKLKCDNIDQETKQYARCA